SCQTHSLPIVTWAARTLGVTAISRNPYAMIGSFAQKRRGVAAGQPASPLTLSGGRGGPNDREVDVGLPDLVEEVGEAVLSGDRDDLHDLAVVEAGIADRVDVDIADVPPFTHDLGRETHCGIRLVIARRTLAIECDLLRSDLR